MLSWSIFLALYAPFCLTTCLKRDVFFTLVLATHLGKSGFYIWIPAPPSSCGCLATLLSLLRRISKSIFVATPSCWVWQRPGTSYIYIKELLICLEAKPFQAHNNCCCLLLSLFSWSREIETNAKVDKFIVNKIYPTSLRWITNQQILLFSRTTGLSRLIRSTKPSVRSLLAISKDKSGSAVLSTKASTVLSRSIDCTAVRIKDYTMNTGCTVSKPSCESPSSVCSALHTDVLSRQIVARLSIFLTQRGDIEASALGQSKALDRIKSMSSVKARKIQWCNKDWQCWHS